MIFADSRPKVSSTPLAFFMITTLALAVTAPAQTLNFSSGFSITPPSVTGGTAATGTIRLPIASSPITVRFTSDNPAAQVAGSVTINPKSLSGQVTISTTAVAAPTTVRITATGAGFELVDTITIVPPVLSTLTLSSAQAAGGATVTGTVRLNGPVAAGQSFRVPLAQSFTSPSEVAAPQQVLVSGGQTSATFAISTSPVLEPDSGTISAGEGALIKTSPLTINPPTIESETVSSFNVPPIVGASSQNGPKVDIRLSSDSAHGSVVALASNSPLVSPRTATLRRGERNVTMGPMTQAVSIDTPVTITVTAGNSSRSADFVISPPSATSMSCPTRTVTGSGTISNCRLTLNGNAPASGIKIALTSNGPGSVPEAVNVATGSQSEPFTVTTTPVSSTTTLTVSSGSRLLGTFSVLAPAVASLVLSSPTVPGGTEVVASVTLSGDAPDGGFNAPLQSGNVFAGTVPASIAIPAGRTTGSFRIATNPVKTDTTVMITAGAIGGSQTVPLIVRANN